MKKVSVLKNNFADDKLKGQAKLLSNLFVKELHYLDICCEKEEMFRYNVDLVCTIFLLQLLPKSASVRGFFLFNFTQDWAPYVMKQIGMYQEGKLKSFIDKGDKSSVGPFIGLDKIVDAVEVRI